MVSRFSNGISFNGFQPHQLPTSVWLAFVKAYQIDLDKWDEEDSDCQSINCEKCQGIHSFVALAENDLGLVTTLSSGVTSALEGAGVAYDVESSEVLIFEGDYQEVVWHYRWSPKTQQKSEQGKWYARVDGHVIGKNLSLAKADTEALGAALLEHLDLTKAEWSGLPPQPPTAFGQTYDEARFFLLQSRLAGSGQEEF